MNCEKTTAVIETDSVSDCFTFIWKIKNYSFSDIMCGGTMRSEVFTFSEDTFHLTASFSIYPINLAVQLHRLKSELVIHGKVFLMNYEERLPKTFKMPSDCTSSQEQYLIHKYNLENNKKEYLPGDCLTIVCKLVASGIIKVPRARRGGEGKDILIRDIGSFLTSGINSDVDIKVEGQTIKAHSQILSARSSVFSAMFGHDMKERQSGIVNITDLKAATIQSLLQYIYTGDAPNIKDMSPDLLMELYVAADKYCIPDLKITCSQAIIDSMTKENAKRYTVLAVKYDDQMIMDEAVSFLAKTIKIKS